MLVLGIETSCDETSVAVLDGEGRVRSNIVSSQLAAHAPYGGVVPEIAARAHLENLPVSFERALEEAGTDVSGIDLVAATAGPGLIGALLVGLSAGKALAFARGVPLAPVNHLEGHLFSAFLRARGEAALPVELPFHGLVVSGGHAELVRVEESRIVPLARTRDDAPGEAFDKVARRAGLGYPGGPVVDRIAARGNGSRYALPVGRAGDGSIDFSFSGLKTAMLRELGKRGVSGRPLEPDSVDPDLVDLLASFQRAIVTALLDRVETVYREERIRALAVSGGVAANSELRRTFSEWGTAHGVPVLLPERAFTTDNAAMIAFAGLWRYRRNGAQDPASATARSRWPLGS
ncbi:MAG TPA: tRNA (adenosine(37)-N6)-threonylcarbamoyltransferase complex transferase subunit TsaD [Thermoanaerobaculia bacterium]